MSTQGLRAESPFFYKAAALSPPGQSVSSQGCSQRGFGDAGARQPWEGDVEQAEAPEIPNNQFQMPPPGFPQKDAAANAALGLNLAWP